MAHPKNPLYLEIPGPGQLQEVMQKRTLRVKGGWGWEDHGWACEWGANPAFNFRPLGRSGDQTWGREGQVVRRQWGCVLYHQVQRNKADISQLLKPIWPLIKAFREWSCDS